VTADLLVPVAFAGIVAGVALAVATVLRLVRLARLPELARAAVAASTPVALAAGPAELALEGPLFTPLFRGLSFEVLDAGRPLPLERLWFRTKSGGFSRTRLSLHRLDVPRPGTYELRVAGLDPSRDYGGCDVVFVPPSGPAIVLTIVSLLASVGLAAASIAVASVLFFRPPPTETADAGAPVPAPAPARPPIAESRGGRPVASDPARLADGKELLWPVLQLRLRVPRDWVIRKVTATELDLRHPTTPSTFVVAHATPMPAGPTIEQYVEAHVAHARDQLEQRLVDGYATKRIGAVPGVLTLERRDDGARRMIAWTGFQPAAVGSLSVTLLAGADASDFAREETLLGAIVDSIRFD
jgi:hypothetical protein